MTQVTSSFNLQNHTWSKVSNHIKRTFERGKYQNFDSNPNVDRSLSYLNKYNDGSITNVKVNDKKVPEFRSNQRKQNKINNYLSHRAIKLYIPWIDTHNKKNHARGHDDRVIKDKASYISKKLNKGSRTIVQGFGNADTSSKVINTIQHSKYGHHGKRDATVKYARIISNSEYDVINQLHKYLKASNAPIQIGEFGTNVDEAKRYKLIKDHGKTKIKQSGLDSGHVHYSLYGFTYTKLDDDFKPTSRHKVAYKSGKRKGQLHWAQGSKPSTDVGRALCQFTHTKYSRRRITVNHKRVNKSVHTALHKFHTYIDRQLIKSVNYHFYKSMPDLTPLHKFTLGRTGNPYHSMAHNNYKNDKQVQDYLKRAKRKQVRDINRSNRKRTIRLRRDESRSKRQRSHQRQAKYYHTKIVRSNRYYKRSVANSKKTKHVLDRQNISLDVKNNRLRSSKAQLQPQVTHLKSQAHKLKPEVRHLKLQRDDLKRANLITKQSLITNQLALAKIRRRADNLKTIIAKRKDMATRYEDKITQSKDQYKNIRQRYTYPKLAFGAVKLALKQCHFTTSDDYIKDIVHGRSRYNAFDMVKRSLNTIKHNYDREVQTKNHELQSARASKITAQSQIDDNRSKANNESSKIASLQSQYRSISKASSITPKRFNNINSLANSANTSDVSPSNKRHVNLTTSTNKPRHRNNIGRLWSRYNREDSDQNPEIRKLKIEEAKKRRRRPQW